MRDGMLETMKFKKKNCILNIREVDGIEVSSSRVHNMNSNGFILLPSSTQGSTSPSSSSFSSHSTE